MADDTPRPRRKRVGRIIAATVGALLIGGAGAAVFGGLIAAGAGALIGGGLGWAATIPAFSEASDAIDDDDDDRYDR